MRARFRLHVMGTSFAPQWRNTARSFRRHGYNYCGSETIVSGFTGEQFEVDIYIGLVYYQRLRHMVSDKFQVRSWVQTTR